MTFLYPSQKLYLLLGVAGHSLTVFLAAVGLLANVRNSDSSIAIEVLLCVGPMVQVLSGSLQSKIVAAAAAEEETSGGSGGAVRMLHGEEEEGQESETSYLTIYTASTSLAARISRFFFYLFVVVALFRRRRRIQKYDLLSEESVNVLVMSTLPTLALPPLVTVLYLVMSSVGCVLNNSSSSGGADDVLLCYDVVASNATFSMLFVVLFFIQIWVIPFASKIYNAENIVKFNFELNEMLQFVMFAAGAVLGVFLYASSSSLRPEELHYFATHNLPFRSAVELASFSLLFLSVSVSFIPRKYGSVICAQKLKSNLGTRNPNELANVYRCAFAFAAVAVLCFIDVPFLFFATRARGRSRDSEEFAKAKSFQSLSFLAWPLAILAVNSFFLSRPKGTPTKDLLLYSTLVARGLMHATGTYMLGMYPTFGGHLTAAILFGLFLYFALHVREALSKSPTAVIQAHMYELLLRLAAAFPPLLFLFAEGVGCISGKSRECELLLQSNWLCSINVAMGVVFYTLFSFCNKDVTVRQIVTLQNFGPGTILQLVFFGAVSFASFFVFGMRPNLAMDYYNELHLLPNRTKWHQIGVFALMGVVSSIWALIILSQGIAFRQSLYYEQRARGDERSSATSAVPKIMQSVGSLEEFFRKKLFALLGTSSSVAAAPLYRSFLPLFVVLNVGLEVAFFVTRNGAWEWGVGAVFELSLLSCILFMFSSFEGGGREVFGVRVSEALILSAPSGIVLSNVVFVAVTRLGDWRQTIVKSLLYFVALFGGSFVVYKAKTVLLESLTPALQTSVVDRVFSVGYGIVFPPIIYIGAEVYGCIFRYDAALVTEVCGGLYPGAKALCLHLVLTLFVSVAFMSRQHDMTRDKIVTLDVTVTQFVQVLLFAVCCLLTLFLYGTRTSGPFTRWQAIQLYAFYALWCLNVALEGSMKLRKRLLTAWNTNRSPRDTRKFTLRWKNSLLWRKGRSSNNDDDDDADLMGVGIDKSKRTDLTSWNVMELAKKQTSFGHHPPTPTTFGGAGFDGGASNSNLTIDIRKIGDGAAAARDRNHTMGGRGEAAIGAFDPGFL